MTNLVQKDEPIPTKYEFNEKDFIISNNKFLASIDKHLNSIVNMLQFFVIIAVLSIFVGGCSAFFASF